VLRAYGEGNIFGEAYGDGPVQVVWLHGWAHTHADFASCGALLAREGVSSVALDLPGFGASPLPPRAGGGALYGELIAPALASLNEGPLVVVGHSFGGKVAAQLAATSPHLIRALVLTGAPLVRLSALRRAPAPYRLVRTLHRRGLIGEARMEAARQKYGSSDYRNAAGILRDILVISVNESYEDQLARIHAPVDLVWGADDAEVPVDVARRAAELLRASSNVDLDVVANTGHLVPTQRPAVLVAHALRLAAS
jgi:pimeloyl-ACP methyl ester carboxylesterase